MSSQNPSQTYPMPSPSVSTFTFPSTTEPIFSASTSEPKEEYETWAMKMEYWIMNSDHNLWNIVLNGNSRKRTGRDPKGNIMILLPVSVEEQIDVQRETKARTILLQSLPEDHMAGFHHLDDARDIWLAVKARFGGNDKSKKTRKSMLKHEFSEFRVSKSKGLHKGYDRFQKILSQLNQMQAKPDNEDCNMKFLRALPPSWSQVAITLKTKGGLDYLSFDDLYNKLRTLEIDVKGGSSYDSRGTSAPTHSAFISAASTNSKMSYPDQSHSTTFTSTSSSHTASSNVMENVLHSFVAESDPQQQITYEDFDQIGKLDLEELDIKWQMAMLSVRINRFEKKAGRKMKFNNKDAARFDKKKVKCYKCSELGHFARECTGKQLDSKARYSSFKLKELDKTEEPKALLSVDSMLNWSDHEGEDVENGAAQVYGMIAGAEDDAAGSATEDVADDVSNAAAEFALMGISSQVHTCSFGCEHIYAELKKEFDNLEVQYKECYIQVQAYKSTLQTLEQQKGWYQSNQLALEERIRILTANLENTTNMLKYTEKLNEQAKLEKLNDKVKLEESNARFDKWKESSKNLVKLINSSMSSRSKFGLGFGDTFGSDEVFDLSAPSIFDSSPKDVAEKPLYDRFVKAVGMHARFGAVGANRCFKSRGWGVKRGGLCLKGGVEMDGAASRDFCDGVELILGGAGIAMDSTGNLGQALMLNEFTRVGEVIISNWCNNLVGLELGCRSRIASGCVYPELYGKEGEYISMIGGGRGMGLGYEDAGMGVLRGSPWLAYHRNGIGLVNRELLWDRGARKGFALEVRGALLGLFKSHNFAIGDKIKKHRHHAGLSLYSNDWEVLLKMFSQDKNIADHIIKVHASADAANNPRDTKDDNWHIQYIQYCRTISRPRLSKNAVKSLQEAYDMRQQDNETWKSNPLPKLSDNWKL
ncbi:putative ribonuclease H-like domain-containing protein [Tanacetum coccineum]